MPPRPDNIGMSRKVNVPDLVTARMPKKSTMDVISVAHGN